MAKTPIFDVVVIGSGSAGFSAVEAAVGQGARVCLVEKGKLGGECPNEACIPSKALLKAASLYRALGTVREFGMDASGRSFNWTSVQGYRERVVARITGGASGERYLQTLKRLKVTFKKGEAKFVDPSILDVGGERIAARAIVIATGTVDFIPPIDGLRDIRFWGWREALTTPRQPKSMAIIGGGPVACEIATFYASFGTRVIILQSAPAVLHREDEEISHRAQEALEQLGIEVVVGAEVLSCVNGGMGAIGLTVRREKSGLKAGSGSAGKEEVFAVETVVVATGMRPNIGHLELGRAELASDGELRTNQEQRTSRAHLFAAGDVDGGMMFTHTAHHEGWVAGHNAARAALKKKGGMLKTDERVVPRVTFLDPEVASVGMTQAQAKEKYGDVLVGRYEIGSLGRAVTDHAAGGLVKLVAHPKTRKLLGAHLICPHAGEMIHEAALAIELGSTIDKVAGMIHAFPTYAEGLKAAASLAKVE
ncbi:NAD(P)/FAD-dependent oxidoreductase [Candidatus Uhrbacteria bacterium]|nr:NAD(P)/FAD-dependent oxidoreductase [Candidatus Uhrbacteria bacterium]